MLGKKLSAVLLLWVSLLTVCAQESMWFRHIDSKCYDIQTLYKDKDGMMWMGTSSGLLSLPQLMTRDPAAYNRKHRELNNFIDRISGDSIGWLCMRTQNRDFILYNPQNDKYVFDTTAELAKDDINVSKEFYIFIDEYSHRWVWKNDRMTAFSFSMKKD